jgi:putative transposase
MAFHPEIYHRRSIRLKDHDYGQGTYFITVCTHRRAPVFGHIATGQMQLSDAGRMVQSVWEQMDAFYPNIRTDAFIVMPDHIHGILHVRAAPRGRPAPIVDSMVGRAASMIYSPVGRPDSIIDSVVGRPDSVIDSLIERPDFIIGRPDRNMGDLSLPDTGQSQGSGQPQGVAPSVAPAVGLSLPDAVHRFKSLTCKRYRDAASCGRLWQRNYWERIVRDAAALHAIRRYIRDNPMNG